jgi:MFS superfamily sulfate permease-like transporter
MQIAKIFISGLIGMSIGIAIAITFNIGFHDDHLSIQTIKKAPREKWRDEVEERLNHRPRKVLGYRTPHEVFFGVEINYTKQTPAVALRN